MRSARVTAGLGPQGDVLTLTRSPPSLHQDCPADLSFWTWDVQDALPPYDDDVSEFCLTAPYGRLVEAPQQLDGVPVRVPSHPCFPQSSVVIPVPAAPSSIVDRTGPLQHVDAEVSTEHSPVDPVVDEHEEEPTPR
jgi:hypothetical protein